MDFKNAGAYKRWIAYAKMHASPGKHPKKITIKGKPHKVDHSRKRG